MAKNMQLIFKKFLKVLPKLLLKVLLGFVLVSIFSVIVLKWINPVTSSIMIQRKLEAMVAFSEKQIIVYYWVSYDEISKQMALAVIAAEDQNFPFHFGFDFNQIEKAIEQNERGGRLRGASTITQQVAKNLFLWEGRSFIRKGIEAYFTLLIEIFWTKERILEVYLNIVEMGDMIFGVGAAGKIFFYMHPEKLQPDQAALLAATLPNPKRYSVRNPSNYVLKRKDWIKRQMRLLGGTSYLKNL
jgi:monofunctional biosynthetic peptidoglycan transglycosylase